MEKDYTRIFNFNIFIDYKINGFCFGLIQLYSTYNPALNRLYITNENIRKIKNILIDKFSISGKTADRYIKKIEEYNLIKKIDSIYIINAVDTNIHNYTKIKYNTLKDILNISINEFDLQIYCYLLNKFQWKKDIYNFTLTELSVSLGYSSNYRGNNNEKIKQCLENLKENNLISFDLKYIEQETAGKKIYISNYILNNVKE